MANTGVRTIVNLGSFAISGAALVDKVTNFQAGNTASGAGLIFVPTANGQQIQLFDVQITTA